MTGELFERDKVVIGLLGTTLDWGTGPERWESWRPSVCLCQQEDLIITRFELLHGRKFTKMAERIAEDIRGISPETTVRQHLVEVEDPWDFELVYGALHDFARGYTFDIEREDYLVH